MKRINVRSAAILFVLLFSLVLSAGCAVPYIDIPPAPSPSPPPAPAPTSTIPPTPINPTWTPSPLPTVAQNQPALPSIADVVAKVKPSVVAITIEALSYDFFNRPFTQQGAGSGWIIDETGIIVTNNHVVEGANSISVTMDDGSTFPVDINSVFTDRLADLAILKVNARDLPALKIGDSSELRIGEWVVAIGNALGQGIRATEGIVSRHGVQIPVSAGQTLYNLVETSAAINPGNSGGPLVNMSGEVIGITSVKIATSGVEGMGYAISTETAIPIIEELIQNGYVVRPWLGVTLYTVDQFAFLRYDLAVEQGVLLTEVAPNSPADLAGFKAGDVIVSFDDKEIATAEELMRAIHDSTVGQTVDATYWREDIQNTTRITLAESPPPP